MAAYLGLWSFKAAFFFPRAGRDGQSHMVRGWAQDMLRALNVRLAVTGEPAKRQIVFVANHVSWIDIPALDAVAPARFVAKSDIRGWPVLGWLSARTGTLFVERHKRRDAARVNQEISSALKSGDRVAVFPESTTGDGTSLYKFHASLLQPAIDANVPLQPLALRYPGRDSSSNTRIAFTGDITFMQSLAIALGEPVIQAEVIFLEPIEIAGRSRHELARLTQQAIARALHLPCRDRGPGTRGGLPA